MATTVQVDDKLHARLREIAANERREIGDVIADAIDRYEREKFWQGVHADFARLRSDEGMGGISGRNRGVGRSQ
jgi:predicted transcriptional regulator